MLLYFLLCFLYCINVYSLELYTSSKDLTFSTVYVDYVEESSCVIGRANIWLKNYKGIFDIDNTEKLIHKIISTDHFYYKGKNILLDFKIDFKPYNEKFDNNLPNNFTIELKDNISRSNSYTWNRNIEPIIAAHEIGHSILGLDDFYKNAFSKDYYSWTEYSSLMSTANRIMCEHYYSIFIDYFLEKVQGLKRYPYNNLARCKGYNNSYEKPSVKEGFIGKDINCYK